MATLSWPTGKAHRKTTSRGRWVCLEKNVAFLCFSRLVLPVKNEALQQERKNHSSAASWSAWFGMKAPTREPALRESTPGSLATYFLYQNVSHTSFVPKFTFS